MFLGYGKPSLIHKLNSFDMLAKLPHCNSNIFAFIHPVDLVLSEIAIAFDLPVLILNHQINPFSFASHSGIVNVPSPFCST